MSAGVTVKVRVPATTANLGPGFDVLGMALDLYNDLEVTATPGPRGFGVAVEGEGAGELERGRDNLVCRAMLRVFECAGYHPGTVRVRARNAVPLARGLGSSAAAVVGGLLAAAALLPDRPPALTDLLELAVEFEGHPDNVYPALLGGLVATSGARGLPPAHLCLPVPWALRLVVAVPAYPLPTASARSVLPPVVSREDAVFNLGRVALLVGALATGDYRVLPAAVDDRLHQPYRESLTPGLAAATRRALAAGARGAFLSGSGPSLVALVEDGPGLEAVAAAVRQGFTDAGVATRILSLRPDVLGARVSGPGQRPVLGRPGVESRATPRLVVSAPQDRAPAGLAGDIAARWREGCRVAVTVATEAGPPSLLAAGERMLAASRLAASLERLGVPARALPALEVRLSTSGGGWDGVVGVEWPSLVRELARGTLPVVAGYRPVGAEGHETGLAPGQPEAATLLLAAALGAGECQFLGPPVPSDSTAADLARRLSIGLRGPRD